MSITVYGCVSYAGAITFENLEACLVQEACVVVSGEHAGQVALTLSDANNNDDCNDTFYGCVNWSTRKFQVIIPDDCCVVGDDCEYCTPGETPASIQVTIAGVLVCCPDCCSYNHERCSRNATLDIDGVYVVPQLGSCTWALSTGHYMRRRWWHDDGGHNPNPGCSGTPDHDETQEVTIYIVKKTDTTADCYIQTLSWGVHMNRDFTASKCIHAVNLPNTDGQLTCQEGIPGAAGGYVTIEEL